MFATGKCPKCLSQKIVEGVCIPACCDGGVERNLSIEIHENPGALFFKGTHRGALLAFVCGECGFTELYLEKADELYKAFEKAKAAELPKDGE